tara:strand:- start:4107 stop:4535 length:429 start_codon:yes stop_codon:yes gene_type:complete
MSIVDVDYMGSAEYEWGALPECLGKMWDYSLKTHSITINNKKVYIIYPWKTIKWKGTEFEEITKYYIDCYTNDINNIYNMVNPRGEEQTEICKSDYGSFRDVINGKNDKNIGWLSISNNYAWFIDKNIANQFTKLVNCNDSW